MELNHLRHFYYVAREGGFSKAAKVLRIAQPAVSKSIKNLEMSLGTSLFDRIGTKVFLTQSGADVFRYCQVIFEQVRAINGLFDKKRDVSGSLNFGVAEGLSEPIVPLVLKGLLKNHPLIKPTFVISTSSDLCQRVSARALEFAMLFHLPPLSHELEIRKQYEIPFRLVIAAKCSDDPNVKQAFIGSREVDVVGESHYPVLNRIRKDFPKAAIVISTNSLSAHRKMVLDGMGVSILPLFMVQNDLKKGLLKCLYAKEEFTFKLKLVCRKGETHSRVSERFIQEFEKKLET